MGNTNNSENIHTACANGQIELVKSLIEQKCDIEARDEFERRPIHFACGNGNIDIFKLLIGHKCDIEACDEFDRRPIHFACDKGHTDLVMLLIQKKCDMEACDWNDHRPIHYACAKGHVDIVKLLIEQKYDIEARDKNNRRPIHIACDNGHVGTVKLLIQQKCDIETRDKDDWRPIHFACDNGCVDIVKLLIERLCNIEAHDKVNIRRPIHFACDKGYVDIVESLIKKKCDIESRDKKDQRPIHIACANGHVDIVQLLIKQKCDIEARDKDNWRPIHFACRFGSVAIVKLLIAHRCNMNAYTKNDESPITVAMQYNHEQLINVIKYDSFKDNLDNAPPMNIAIPDNHGQLIKTMKYESFKENLAMRIKKASEMKCSTDCNHESCPMNLILTASQKKTFIGGGTFGEVYKLTDPETNLEYAMKSIRICYGGAKNEVKNLEDDINSYRDVIKHPRIIEYFGSFSYLKNIYIFMEYFSKGSLYEEIQEARSLHHQTILRYAKQILEGVEFLHLKKVIHRDIKPQNILLDDDNNTKLCDFGTSKLLPSITIQSKANEQQNKVVQANTFCGTVYYMAPEVYTSGGYSFPADIWSVGATIVHMLTSRPPYSPLCQEAVIFKIGTEKKIEYEPLEPMSDNMKLFVKKSLIPDPLKRATAKELLKFLIDHNMI